MRFKLDITLTEEQYVDYNFFHVIESTSNQRSIMVSRIKILCFIALLMLLTVTIYGLELFSVIIVIVLSLFSVVCLLFFKKLLKRNVKSKIQKLKKKGKLPFNSAATFEFYEDKLVEITANKRSERGYDSLERICVVEDRFILLYLNSMGAFILPDAQVTEQVDKQEFLNFLSQKCNTVEFY